jgi:hypothetical protein
LKNIGLALHNYHDVSQTFPPANVYNSAAQGYDGVPDATNGGGHDCYPQNTATSASSLNGAPWTVLILPYLEQAPLYSGFDFAQVFTGWVEHAATPVGKQAASANHPASVNYALQILDAPSVFKCPSNPAVRTDPYINCYNACMGGGGPAFKTDSSGAAAVDGTIPVNIAQDNQPKTGNVMMPCSNNIPAQTLPFLGANSNWRPLWNNGAMHLNSSVSVEGIRDGTSNTILVGETMYITLADNYGGFGGAHCTWASSARPRTGPGQCCPMIGNTASVFCGMNQPQVEYTLADAKARGGAASGHSMIQLGFSSWHTGGGHVCLADGSVRFISENAEITIQQKMGAVRDGMVTGEL